MKLSEVAHKLSCRLEGFPEIDIHGVAGIEHAQAGQITCLANRRYFPLLKTTRASAVLVDERIALDSLQSGTKLLLETVLAAAQYDGRPQ